MTRQKPASAPRPDAAAVVTKGVMRAAQRLESSNRVVAATLGVSEATIALLGPPRRRTAAP
jgi:hypothetical protein